MSDETREIARRVVSRLLGEEYASHEDFEKRPGGAKDPYRQTTVKMAFKKKDFTGKRGTKPVASTPGPVKSKAEKSDDDGDEGEKPKSRFDLKFAECVAGKQAAKAFKKPKTQSGKAVAGKPGKVSYKEALMRHVLEKLAKKKKAAKGAVVAKAPGKVSYKGEAVEAPELDLAAGAPGPDAPQAQTWEDFWATAQQDAVNASDDPDYLNTLNFYLQAGGVDAYKGLEGQALAQRIARTPRETWARFGQQVTSLRQQWEQHSAPEAAPEAAPEEAPAPQPPRDRPPHVESISEAKIKGVKGKAKRMLGLVAKAPGAVKRGKK